LVDDTKRELPQCLRAIVDSPPLSDYLLTADSVLFPRTSVTIIVIEDGHQAGNGFGNTILWIFNGFKFFPELLAGLLLIFR